VLLLGIFLAVFLVDLERGSLLLNRVGVGVIKKESKQNKTLNL
jgi:hypothetical protein